MRQNESKLIGNARFAMGIAWACLIALLLVCVFLYQPTLFSTGPVSAADSTTFQKQFWKAPDTSQFENHAQRDLLRYGRKLITRTSYYLGPQGIVSQQSNGMNCQNCHLESGTKIFGNNYSSVASLYPRFRERSGSKESIEKRINDCLERSLNGKPLDSLSHEMRSLVAYLKWVGSEVPKGKKAKGSGLWKIALLDRAADTVRGKIVYTQNCKVCHGDDGEGLLRFNGKEYLYPPLWGKNSFNTAAGLYRLSNIAGYVYTNMPQGTTFERPLLTEEQAWDVAAFIVSKTRPHKTFAGDWPNLRTKPFDHPFGPYTDSFSESQHKLGPFQEILELRSAQK
jgi:thiosulfate dehydrogenase